MKVANVEESAKVLGSSVGTLPYRYLGLPLGTPFKSTWVWDMIKERFQKRFVMWKRQYLSKGGRLTLIKSMLSSCQFTPHPSSLFQDRWVSRCIHIILQECLAVRECVDWSFYYASQAALIGNIIDLSIIIDTGTSIKNHQQRLLM